MASRPQPGKNKTIRTQRRRVIAKKLVEQIPPSKIAEQIGISRQMVNVEIRAPETQGFIKGAMAPHLDEIAELIPLSLGVVRTILVGQFYDAADKLRAAKTVGYFMELADGRKSDGDISARAQFDRFSGTLENLLALNWQTIHEAAPREAGETRRVD